MSEPTKNFWQTVPGVVTAIAALITALGGLVGVLIQSGVISGGGHAEQPAAAQSVATTSVAPSDQPSTDATAGAGEPAGLIPWDRASARFVRNDGTTAMVKAQTVSLACDTGKVKLDNGQEVSLELVDSIRIDAVYTETATADGAVSLLDGRTLTDPIFTWNCPVSGTNELGTVSIDLQDIKRIDFLREAPAD